MSAVRAIVAVALLWCAVASYAEAPSTASGTAARLNAQLAVAYLQRGEIAAAREKVEKALKENDRDSAVHTAAALVFERLQDRDQADRHYAEALRLDPKNPELMNNYAVFDCRNGRAAAGQKLFEQAARNPAYTTPEVAYANAGVCARAAGDLAAAEAAFRRALEQRANFPDALLQLADLTFQKGNGLAARGLLERYFQAAPHTADALALAVRVERGLGDATTARRYFDELVNRYPDAVQVRELQSAGAP